MVDSVGFSLCTLGPAEMGRGVKGHVLSWIYKAKIYNSNISRYFSITFNGIDNGYQKKHIPEIWANYF